MIKIMIDSAADIGMEEAKNLGITMVPMNIMIGDEEYYDGVNLSPTDFFEKLIGSEVLPKTSLVNSFRWEEEIQNVLGEDDELILITISSKLSGTYKSACDAAEKFNGKVHVIDSYNAAIGERLLCLYALELVKQGLSAQEIVALLDEKKLKIKVIALIDTLEYLKKGGRISSALAFAGSLMSVKPVIGVVDGEVKVLGKALGSRKGTTLLNKLIQESNGIDFSMPLGTLWSGLSAEMLDRYIQNSTEIWENSIDTMPKYPLGATIGTHIGPGAVGFAFFEK